MQFKVFCTVRQFSEAYVIALNCTGNYSRKVRLSNLIKTCKVTECNNIAPNP